MIMSHTKQIMNANTDAESKLQRRYMLPIALCNQNAPGEVLEYGRQLPLIDHMNEVSLDRSRLSMVVRTYPREYGPNGSRHAQRLLDATERGSE